MNLEISLILACFTAGLFGAAAGAMLAWRLMYARVEGKFTSRLQTAIVALLQSQVEQPLKQFPGQTAIEASTVQGRAEGIALAETAGTVHVEPVAIDLESLANRMTTHFDTQSEIQSRTQRQSDQAMQQALQAIQHVLESQQQQQAEREQALSLRQERWLAGQELLAAKKEECHASELQMLLQALTELAGKPASSPLTEFPVSQFLASPHATAIPVDPPSRPPPPVPVSTSAVARPPELLHAPIVQPEPVFIHEEPTREFTNEELDAMPPELPTSDKPRKRILPLPKKPAFRSL